MKNSYNFVENYLKMKLKKDKTKVDELIKKLIDSKNEMIKEVEQSYETNEFKDALLRLRNKKAKYRNV